jgi:single-strand DNA-binding protein
MAGNFNRVFLMGNLTRDIELRNMPSGMAVASFAIAVNERFKNRQDEWVERANFIDCEAFARTAEVMAQYLSKGRPVFIEGKLRLDQWEDKDGGKRSKLKVVVENFQFIDSKGEGGSGGPGGRSSGGYGGGERSSRPASRPTDGYEPIDEDDIPF